MDLSIITHRVSRTCAMYYTLFPNLEVSKSANPVAEPKYEHQTKHLWLQNGPALIKSHFPEWTNISMKGLLSRDNWPKSSSGRPSRQSLTLTFDSLCTSNSSPCCVWVAIQPQSTNNFFCTLLNTSYKILIRIIIVLQIQRAAFKSKTYLLNWYL
jgi:hypothetical protein